MDLSLRRAVLDDFAAIKLLDGAAFGYLQDDEDFAESMSVVDDPAHFLLAHDGPQLIGVTGHYELQMTMPGGAPLDLPGVTWVSVSPTHRRRGVLRALMERQLANYVAEGRPAAILTASESGIYGRFGYGAATQTRRITVDRRRAELRTSPKSGSVRIATAAEAAAAMPAIHDRWRATMPGAIARSPQRWAVHLSDRPSSRDGMSALFYLLHDDGYVAYRVKEDWGDWNAAHVCNIRQFAAVTLEAEIELWHVLLGLDLFGSIETDMLPVDDPLPFLITEPRLVRTASLLDGVWVRPLDVCALLSARRYPLEVEVCLDVRDEQFGDGRYLLRGGPDGADCTRTDRTPDLSLDVATLGSLSLGGHRLGTLVRAGLVDVAPGVDLARVEAALLSERAPFHGTGF